MKNIYLTLFLIASANIFAQVEKVEPPFWWSNMKNSQLQILLYGKNIADFNVTSNLNILEIQKTENKNYIFVTVDTQNKQPDTYKLELWKNNQKKQTINYSLKERTPNSHLRKGFDSSDVIYLVMPDRFANANPNNDNHPSLSEKVNRTDKNARHGGDLQGIINNIPYIKSLGATALWSTPLCQDNDPQGSYHTYAQSDVYQIDARFGTNDDYLNLSSQLHKNGMKLIMDYVTNHWGEQHWIVKDLPTYSWLHQFPGYGQTTYRMTTQLDSNASEYDKKYCEKGWFVKSMPDLNQDNPLVLNYLTQNAIWWIEYANLDGLRVDTYSYNSKDAIAKWTNSIMQEYPHFNIVGEVWLQSPAQISYWQKDSPISAIQSYNTHLPSVMDFPLMDALTSTFSQKPQWNKGMIQLYESFTNDFLYKNINNLLIFAENHDTPRINQIYSSLSDYKLITTILATTRGIPQLYYGSEIGMAGDKSQGDGDIRRDFPGGWSSDSQNAFSQSGRTSLQNQYFNFTSTLFNWRKNKSVIHYGKLLQFLPINEVYVYLRYNDSETVMVVINNGDTQNLDLSPYQEILKNFTSAHDVISNQNFKLSSPLPINSKSSLILELSK